MYLCKYMIKCTSKNFSAYNIHIPSSLPQNDKVYLNFEDFPVYQVDLNEKEGH